MIFAGIDYSITSPAIAICKSYDSKIKMRAWNGHKHLHAARDVFDIQVLPYPQYETEIERLTALADAMALELLWNEVQYVFIEGYSFGASGKVFNIAEGCGILKHLLYREGILTTSHSPGTIKKFATGTGSAKKEQMMEQFEQDTQLDLFDLLGKKRGLKTIPSPLTDLVDAYYICLHGRATIPNPQIVR